MIIKIIDFNTKGYPTVPIDVKLTPRNVGTEESPFIQGSHIRRRDNNRIIGWVVPRKGEGVWVGYLAESAFQGDGPDDDGNILDKVPVRLIKREKDGWAPIRERTRADAAEDVVRALWRGRAPGLGFPRHSEVARWADR